MLFPRRAYASLAAPSPSYIPAYVIQFALIAAVSAGIGATGRITVGLVISLTACWMFVPVLHVLIGAALVHSSRPNVGYGRALASLLRGHAPWTIWLVSAAVLMSAGGYQGLGIAEILAVVPIVLTWRIVNAFCIEVLGTTRRGAIKRTVLHQLATWIVAGIYLDRAVSLMPRIMEFVR